MAEEAITFDEILADPAYKSEFDRRVTKALATVQEKLNAAMETNKRHEQTIAEANKAIEGFKALDVEGIKKAADEWKAKAEQAEKDAAAQVAAVKFDAQLDNAIQARKGRSATAIKALLDLDALRASQNQEADLQAALDGLAGSDAYLFDTGTPAPPYAGGPGTGAAGLDREQFRALGYRERLALKQKDPELYEQLKES
ncbi:phage scaffolding protein [Allofournierella sp.]|uniref:phage scaffolding protein n=1 Tax=Allofournierella sp. TaxID=1940256 RepID=UPI003AF19E37